MVIQVITKNVYGNSLIYPVTHEEDLTTLTRQKTVTRQQIQALKNLGLSFELITDKPKVI